MKVPRKRRSPGRPRASQANLSRERIEEVTLRLLEEQGFEALSMRSLARTLAVDPMALYHYFPDKNALLRAVAARVYGALQVPPPHPRDWQKNLLRLAHAYLEVLARARKLLLHLSVTPSDAVEPIQLFETHFRAAVAVLQLSPALARDAHAAFVDFLHGYSLALTQDAPLERRALAAELRILLAGIHALSSTGS